jgi:stage II sporulation protein M
VAYKSAIKRKLLAIAVAIYVTGFLVGVGMKLLYPDSAKIIEDQLSTITSQFEGIDSAARVYSKILLHNLSVCAIMTFAGIVFAVAPVFILFVNGLPLGIVLTGSEKPIWIFLTAVLPHGIFELSATMLAGALGILLGLDAFQLVRYWMRGEGEASTRILISDLRKVLKAFLIVLVLLAVAAAVETFLFFFYGSS